MFKKQYNTQWLVLCTALNSEKFRCHKYGFETLPILPYESGRKNSDFVFVFKFCCIN
jgi:hypothetical protein